MTPTIKAGHAALTFLRAQYDKAEKVRAEATARCERLLAGIAALEAELTNPNKSRSARRSHGRKEAPPNKRPARVAALPMADAAAVIVKEAGRALKVNEIIAGIHAKGLFEGELRRTSLVAALDRKCHNQDTFTKPSPGTYALIGTGNGKG